MIHDISQNNKRIAKNTFTLTLRMLFTMVIGIYTSRILLTNLGIVDYGINNVVAGIITLFTFFNASLIGATQRYLNYYLGKNDLQILNKVFSTSINIFIIIAAIITILGETIGFYFLNYKLNIPDDRLIAANWVFQFTIISSFINIISAPYNALIIAKERMATFAYVSMVQSICLLIFSLLISYTTTDKLVCYALLVCLLHIGIRVFYSWYCSHNFKEIKYKRIIDKSLFKEMLSFSGWTLTGTIAYMTYTQGLTFIINMFFGPTVNAAQALAQQVNNSLSTFSANFMMASKPQITKYYAEGHLNKMHNLIFMSSKLSFFIMAMVSLPFIMRTNYVLNLWLTKVPEHTALFLQLYLSAAIINTLTSPAVTAIHSTGNIKQFQLFESLILIMILPISYLLLTNGGIPESCYIVMIILCSIAQGIRVYFMKKQIHLNITDYISKIVIRMVVTFGLAFVSSSIANLFISDTFAGFITESIICTLTLIMCFYICGLDKMERANIYCLIKKKLRK